MRVVLILSLIPLPGLAWDFSPDPICTLTHQTDAAEIAITFDASLPEYALFVTLRDGVWGDPPTFQMVFTGPRRLQIGTDQHRISADGATLSVRDAGFGNVLDGLEFNVAGAAATPQTTVLFGLSDAAPAVRAFRACPADNPATS